MNLNEMTSAELEKLREDVEAAIAERRRQDLAEAKAAAEAAAARFGFTLTDLVNGQKPARLKPRVKYRNPKDPSQTWSGRGRKPEWLISALKAGTDISDFEIRT